MQHAPSPSQKPVVKVKLSSPEEADEQKTKCLAEYNANPVWHSPGVYWNAETGEPCWYNKWDDYWGTIRYYWAIAENLKDDVRNGTIVIDKMPIK